MEASLQVRFLPHLQKVYEKGSGQGSCDLSEMCYFLGLQRDSEDGATVGRGLWYLSRFVSSREIA